MTASTKRLAWVAAAMLGVVALAPAAQAQGFLSFLFGGGRPHAPRPTPMPFVDDGPLQFPPQYDAPRQRAYGRGQAYCVRTCDGRYFPVNGSDNQSRAAACDSFCPASDTEIVYGSSIDSAATEKGKPYSELPNAFRYRNELVAGCTCNGKDKLGLAPVPLENDPTLRKGDIVARESGLVVANRDADKRGAALNFSPASERVRARYERVPVMARE
jgi:hypothetical protein